MMTKEKKEEVKKVAEQKPPQLPQPPPLTKEQATHQRKIQTENETIEIECSLREKKFKEEQLKSEIVETRFVNQLPGQPALVITGYKDQLKPRYLLENEIARIDQMVKIRRETIENMRKQEEKDGKSNQP